jgi:hypothetical protein
MFRQVGPVRFDEETSPNVKLLLSREFVYDVGLNELWITWKEFVPLVYHCQDIALFTIFSIRKS